MFWKSQPEYKFHCKSHDEQFHFSNPQDDMIEKTGQVVIIRHIQVILVVTIHVLKTNPSRKYWQFHVSDNPVVKIEKFSSFLALSTVQEIFRQPKNITSASLQPKNISSF